MKRLSNLTLTPKQLFLAAGAALFLMMGLLLSPLVPARLLGTPVTISYQSSFIDKEMTVYPILSIESISKEQLPPLLETIFYSSVTERDAYEIVNEIDQFYLIVDDASGVLQIVDVVTTRPRDLLYITAESMYLEYNRMSVQESAVWQDNFSGVRFVFSNNLSFYAPRTLSETTRQAVLNGTATFDAYLWNGQFYFVDFNL